ncbi:hypothetical protein GMMP1_60029 [Candidatus Magnetomoraceae bacterium gMMP-1]
MQRTIKKENKTAIKKAQRVANEATFNVSHKGAKFIF